MFKIQTEQVNKEEYCVTICCPGNDKGLKVPKQNWTYFCRYFQQAHESYQKMSGADGGKWGLFFRLSALLPFEYACFFVGAGTDTFWLECTPRVLKTIQTYVTYGGVLYNQAYDLVYGPWEDMMILIRVADYLQMNNLFTWALCLCTYVRM